MVKVVTMVGERLIEVDVDGHELAQSLRLVNNVAKHQGLRPGQPTNLTGTPSDPISHEKFETLYQVLLALRNKKL